MEILQNGTVFTVTVLKPKGIKLENILAIINKYRPENGNPITVKITSPTPLVNFKNFRSPTEHHPKYNKIFYTTNFRKPSLQRLLGGLYPTRPMTSRKAHGSTS